MRCTADLLAPGVANADDGIGGTGGGGDARRGVGGGEPARRAIGLMGGEVRCMRFVEVGEGESNGEGGGMFRRWAVSFRLAPNSSPSSQSSE